MVFCGLCKENKDSRYIWCVDNHTVEKDAMARYKICDDCASLLLRRMMRKMMGARAGQQVDPNVMLTRTGLIQDLILNESNMLEVSIALDYSKAKKLIEKHKAGIDILNED